MALRHCFVLSSTVIAVARGFIEALPVTLQFGGRVESRRMAMATSGVVDLKALASANIPFSPKEAGKVVAGLKALSGSGSDGGAVSVDWLKLEWWLQTRAHKPHKEWAMTAAAAEELAGIVGGPDAPCFRRTFSRVLEGGRWGAAAEAAASAGPADRPWVVLVTGLNGIRKTTSVYEPWFKAVLREALGEQLSDAEAGVNGALPSGVDSFYRQLDFMVASLAVEEFKSLYGAGVDVAEYSARKVLFCALGKA
jgi:hypothetical protein